MLDIGVAPGQKSNGMQPYSKLLVGNDSNLSNSRLGFNYVRICQDITVRAHDDSGAAAVSRCQNVAALRTLLGDIAPHENLHHYSPGSLRDLLKGCAQI